MYGGISIYDILNDRFGRLSLKEVLLLCDTALSSHALQSIISNGNTIYLVIYSLNKEVNINIDGMIKPTRCQGIHVKRLVP